ncbi:polysaccharide biosynthesis tyrosine autokinase [Actinomyces sp.]|uniref:polysaccharide biosynthesis tyrosine autokinase n=1 Tax=Actinomyces sp. TaxID=29317 RepID=UPI0028983D98|nr:polysaccharide biosynthesis tyrosine autokinase [Actinomyces sp.]
MTLEDFLKLTRRHIGAILMCMVLGGVGAFGLLQVTPTQYTAGSTAYVRVTVPTDDGTEASANAYYNASQLATQKVKAFVPVFTSQTVAQAVIDDLKLNTTPSELAGNLTASNATNSLTISVTATADTADQARAIADAVVDKAAIQVKELEGEDSPVSIVLMAPAALSTITVTPSPAKYIAAGILAGLLLGYVIAFARTTLDTRIRTAEDIQERAEVPILGVIPQSNTVARSELDDAKDFRAAESLRKLRTNLRYADVDRELRSIVITSPMQGDGKSSVASNLAKVMAMAGQDVLLIDADLRRPTVRETFGVASKIGLTQVLVGAAALEQAISATAVEGLSVLPAGDIPPNPSELLGSQRMSELLAYLSRDCIVIVDAPPVLPVTDAAVLAKSADGVVMVVSAGKTNAEQLEHSLEGIAQTGGKVLGVVLNRAASSKLAKLKYGDAQYGYGYGYGDAAYGDTQTKGHRPVRQTRPVATGTTTAASVEKSAPSSAPIHSVEPGPVDIPRANADVTRSTVPRRVSTSERTPVPPAPRVEQADWAKVVGEDASEDGAVAVPLPRRSGVKFPPLHGRS